MTEFNNAVDGSNETKVLRVKDGNGTAHTVRIDKFNADGCQAFDDAGFRGGYKIYTLMDSGIVESHYDAYILSTESVICGLNSAVVDFIKAVHTGGISWEQVVHDDVLYPADIRELENGSG